MYGVEVTLPGGLAINGSIERRVRFHSLTGKIEQALIEPEMALDSHGYVTAALGFALDSIGGQPVDASNVADLCVADRQYLMLRLAAMINGEQMWLNVGCGHCDELFDVEIHRSDLPVKEAGPGFPIVTLRVNEWVIDVRVPTGADQEGIGEQTGDEAIKTLLRSCIVSVNGEAPKEEFIDNLTESDIETIDKALDEVSPAVCTQLLVTCPECGKEQSAELNHYHLTGLNGNAFYDKVHTLALCYHWSEEDILNMPQSRRNRYLDLINRSNVMTGQV